MDTIQDRILGEAARLCARLVAADCSEQERRECERWLAADAAHGAAFAQVKRMDAQMDKLIGHSARLQRLADAAFAAGADIPNDVGDHVNDRVVNGRVGNTTRRRVANRHHATVSAKVNILNGRAPLARTRKIAAYAAAASMALAAVAISRAPWELSSFTSLERLADEPQMLLEASTQRTRQVTLADGTMVHIDAGGKLRVALSEKERRVEVLEGRAFFQVAHDKTRPFSVTAGGTRTVALGTQFEVHRRGGETLVALAEGSVAISGVANGTQWQERLQPGEQLDVDSAARVVRRTVDAQSIGSWSRGWLVFHAAPLAEALNDINRYSAKQVVLADRSLTDLTVSGSFVVGDAQSIVDAIAEVLPIRVVDGGAHEIILFKRYDN